MNSFLKELYEGEIRPHETVRPSSKESQATIAKIGAVFTELKAALGADKQALLHDLDELHTELTTFYSFENFKEGFRLGVNCACTVHGYNDDRQ